jgi:hypothetical protein
MYYTVPKDDRQRHWNFAVGKLNTHSGWMEIIERKRLVSASSGREAIPKLLDRLEPAAPIPLPQGRGV